MFDEFSSPLGDGLVLVHPNVKYDIIRFSSPSGDGLVLTEHEHFALSFEFSSPSGDGLVPAAIENIVSVGEDFRPRVGMGWFTSTKSTIVKSHIFVPAWGWVGSANAKKAGLKIGFSSPLGDGLVPPEYLLIESCTKFSSPSGDGLVPEAPADDDAAEIIFVPEWGWVGSLMLSTVFPSAVRRFRPRLGMGWFKIVSIGYSEINDFRPHLGMGWFLKERWLFLWQHDFRPRLGMGWFFFRSQSGRLKKHFRPRLGMGWFFSAAFYFFHFLGDFRPRVGMGWFA